MCYDIQAKLQTQLKRAKLNNDHASILELTEKLERFTGKPLFHASGFSHPEVLIYPNTSKYIPVPAIWGLIPSWMKSYSEAKQMWNQTLNARSESMFDKPSFQESAKFKRCIIPVDGFFEHRHVNGNPIPHYIRREDDEPMNLAGLFSEWRNPLSQELLTTFTIVTQKATDFMATIHNNPKIPEPRMPFILNEEEIDYWLEAATKEDLMELLKKDSTIQLKTHTVQKLKGKHALGNQEAVTKEFFYPELGPSLFD